MKKKILIISSEFLPDPGGIGNHAFHLAKNFAENGYSVTVIADIVHTDKAALSSFKQNLPFYFIAIVRKEITLYTYFERVQKAIKASASVDVVICSGKFSLWLIHLVKAVRSKTKAIAIVHGTELQLPHFFHRKLLNSALAKFNSIVAVSAYTKNFIPSAIKEKINCIVIPNGIDTNEFDGTEKKIHQPIQVITIGSVTERKGQENVIKAMPLLSEKFPGLVYHVVGTPVITERLQKLSKELAIEIQVIFHGKLSRKDLLNILKKASVKMMLSNHTTEGDFEGFGIAILEANACGLPAITSNFGGNTDAVSDRKTGRLVDPYNPEAIAEALNDIVDNYKQYSSTAINWAKQHDWKKIILQYIALIEGGI